MLKTDLNGIGKEIAKLPYGNHIFSCFYPTLMKKLEFVFKLSKCLQCPITFNAYDTLNINH